MLGIVLVVAASTGLAMLPSTLTSAQRQCSIVSYAMNTRTCFKIKKSVVDPFQIHDKETVVEISLQTEGFLHDPKHVCEKKQMFTELYDCLGGITSNCPMANAEKEYLPSTELTIEGLNDFCDHIEDVDIECYNASYKEVFECVQKLSAQNIMPNDTTATKACTTVDITHDCIHATVQCNDTTRDMLLTFQDIYRKPSACSEPARSDRKRYITIPGDPTGGGVAAAISKMFCFFLSFVIILMSQA